MPKVAEFPGIFFVDYTGICWQSAAWVGRYGLAVIFFTGLLVCILPPLFSTLWGFTQRRLRVAAYCRILMHFVINY